MKRFSIRGQLSFEYIILTGVLLAILIPVLYTSLSTFNEYYKTTRIDDLLSQVVDKANDLYKIGPGNKDTINIVVPAGITGATIAGNEFSVDATLGKQPTTVRKYADSDLIGSLETAPGEYTISIKALNESLVRIGSGPWILELNPSCISAPNFANPPTITLYGDDFFPTSILLLDGVPFDPTFYQIIDPGTIIFIAGPSQFWAQPGNEPYIISVQDGTKISNTVDFYVYPNIQQCS